MARFDARREYFNNPNSISNQTKATFEDNSHLLNCYEFDEVIGVECGFTGFHRYVPPSILNVKAGRYRDQVREALQQFIRDMRNPEIERFEVDLNVESGQHGEDISTAFLARIYSRDMKKIRITKLDDNERKRRNREKPFWVFEVTKLPREVPLLPWANNEYSQLDCNGIKWAAILEKLNINAIYGWNGPGAYPCRKAIDCTCCKSMSASPFLTKLDGTRVPLWRRYNCKNKHVVYYWACGVCKEVDNVDTYVVGSTKTLIKNEQGHNGRMTNYFYNLQKSFREKLLPTEGQGVSGCFKAYTRIRDAEGEWSPTIQDPNLHIHFHHDRKLVYADIELTILDYSEELQLRYEKETKWKLALKATRYLGNSQGGLDRFRT